MTQTDPPDPADEHGAETYEGIHKGPPSLDEPGLPLPVRAALEAADELDAIAAAIDAWAPDALASITGWPDPHWSSIPEAPPAVVAWFRKSFLAVVSTFNVRWYHHAPCPRRHHRHVPLWPKPYQFAFLVASATTEYERDDALRLLLPGLVGEFLLVYELGDTIRCAYCRKEIDREIRDNCRGHYRSLLASAKEAP